jgi:hypothetical protein
LRETEGDKPVTELPAWDLSLGHLEAELARIDVSLRRQARLWQLAGQDPADAFRGLYVSEKEAEALLARPLASHWGRAATLSAAEEEAFRRARRQADLQARALAESARCQGHPVRLVQLASTFNLDHFDLDVLLIALAPALDLRYERLYGYLQDDVTKKRPTVNLALDLLCEPDKERLPWLARFTDDAALVRHELVQLVTEPGSVKPPLLGRVLAPDEAVLAWLLGHYVPHVDLRPGAELSSPQGPGAAAQPMDPAQCEALRPCVTPGSEAPLVVFSGPDALAQEDAATWLARQRKQPLLRVNLAPIIEGGVPPLRGVRLALRDARLTAAVLYLTGWEAIRAENEAAAEATAALCAFPGLAIIAGSAAWQAQGSPRNRLVLNLAFPVPSYVQRRELWERFLAAPGAPGSAAETAEQAIDVTAVAGQFVLASAQIRDAAATARDSAQQRGASLSRGDLLVAARAHSNPNLANLARKITPRYGWSDIVLPADQVALLREIVATVRGRPVVLEEWGLGRKLVSGQGIPILFAGPPGTGKTMAAEIIAGELGLDLYKIDLSTVVSKYIGETEKNLERIFAEAERSNAILFFDEADALFGKRSEVRDSHDRYANIEISYLLQRMEAYDGVTILATNLRANLDEAFTRRLQFAVDFPFPEEKERLRIWQTLFPADVPAGPDLDFGLLARRFKLAGGSIRNIIVNAAYLAASDGRCVSMELLLHSTRRELQKMGRLVNEDHMLAQES